MQFFNICLGRLKFNILRFKFESLEFDAVCFNRFKNCA